MKLEYIKELENYSKLIFGEGVETISPLQEIKYKNKSLFIKHEDRLFLQCAKQRSILYMLMKYIESGKRNFVISSSGHAALVSAYTVSALKDRYKINKLIILLSNQTSNEKLSKFIKHLELNISVRDLRNNFKRGVIEFNFADNPKQQAFQLAQEGYVNLRGSTDDLALIGFKAIAHELVLQMEDRNKVDGIFVPASSGTTALGIYQGFHDLDQNPAMHVIQTTKVNTLVKKMQTASFEEELNHPSESITDYIGHRRKQVEEMIVISNGKGWIISKQEVIEGKKELANIGIEASYDSALPFAAYLKATEEKEFECPVLVFTG